MRLGLGVGIVAIVAAIIGLALLVGGLQTAFQRETTGIKARYSKPLTERTADIFDPADELGIADNGSTATSPRPIGSGDHDGDGVSDEAERGGAYPTLPDEILEVLRNGGEGSQDSDGDGVPDIVEEFLGTDPNDPNSVPRLGTDPLNPDTDGDGVADGIEILRGTDPTDPRDGGATRPPVAEPRTPNDPPRLNVKHLEKKVRESGSQEYAGFAEITLGATAHFRIEAEVENTGSGALTVAIKDTLPPSLQFVSGTVGIGSGGDRLTAEWFNQTHLITLGPKQSQSILLQFTVSAGAIGSFTNRVEVYDANHPERGDRAEASVVVREKIGTGGSGSLEFNVLNKQVRASGESAYRESITTTVGETLDFKITLTLDNPSSAPRTVILTDDLPSALTPIPNSGNGSELFSKGYISVTVPTGAHVFEYTFSATVVSGAGSTTANTAKAYEAKFAPNGAIDKTQITING